jgi:predicted GIY-YIG superfamily endonuclease
MDTCIMAYYVYILASRRDGATYIGVTNDLVRRVFEHRTKAVPGFTSKYNITRLVWFEIYEDPISAIFARERTQEMEAELEDSIDRSTESAVGRFVRFDL